MLDLIVTGGIAVLPSGAEPADIGISGGKIAAIGAPGSLLSAGAARIVDAPALKLYLQRAADLVGGDRPDRTMRCRRP